MILKRSITRESLDVFNKTYAYGIEITNASTTNTSATITLAEPHSLNSISGFNAIAGNNGSHTEGTYYNVKLLNAANTNTWDGATADVVVDVMVMLLQQLSLKVVLVILTEKHLNLILPILVEMHMMLELQSTLHQSILPLMITFR